jgi:uncharacterized BrkB/YihY/UPF0761 family membrane protein
MRAHRTACGILDAGSVGARISSLDRPDSEGLFMGRVDDGKKRAMGRLESWRSTMEARRSQSTLVDTGFILYERKPVFPMNVLAGAIASRLVIFAIPLFALLTFSLGFYSEVDASSASELARSGGMAGLLAQSISESTSQPGAIRWMVVIATASATLWAADSLARLLRRVVALAWGVPLLKPKRRWLLPVFMILGAILVVAISTIIGSTRDLPAEVVVAEFLLELVLFAAVWLFVSRLLPHEPTARSWIDFVPGSVLCAVSVGVMRAITVIYFAPKSESLADRYGAIAIMLVMLSWAYLIGLITIGSAVLNAATFHSRSRGSAGETSFETTTADAP